ncbi:MAG: L,D-transpeptidase [Pseudomonadales bacterium]
MKQDTHIVVQLEQQKLALHKAGKPIAVYRVSTALKGPGELSGSEQTPRGQHVIRAKIGAGLPENAVLVGRRFTGEVYNEKLAERFPGRDWILTRILWLSGSEVGFNRLGEVDTMRRYIYIHGTPESEPIGVAKSHGCIRMHNADLIDLFDRVESGCPVLIEE